MSKFLLLFVVASILLVSCKSKSFNSQRYTHFKQMKSQEKKNGEKADLALQSENRNNIVTRDDLKYPKIAPVSGNMETDLYSGLDKNIITIKQKEVSGFGKDLTILNSGKTLYDPALKTFHSLKIKNSANKAQHGPLGWLIDTVFGIIIFVLVILLIIFLVVVLLF